MDFWLSEVQEDNKNKTSKKLNQKSNHLENETELRFTLKSTQ